METPQSAQKGPSVRQGFGPNQHVAVGSGPNGSPLGLDEVYQPPEAPCLGLDLTSGNYCMQWGSSRVFIVIYCPHANQ